MEQNLDFLAGKRIMITGGGGYLGSKLAQRLSSANTHIALLDIRFNWLSEDLTKSNYLITKHLVDITNRDQLEVVCQKVKPDYVFHFSALLDRERDFGIFNKLFEVNVKGTLNLLESLRSVNYERLFFSSTSEVYGTKNPVPFHEEQLPNPASPYSLTKLMAENTIVSYSDLHHRPYTILRLFNFFGTDMPENFFINQLITSLKQDQEFKMTKGEQSRDFLEITDLIDSILAITKTDKSNSETINICSGKGLLLRELATEVAQKLKKEHLLKIGAIPYRENEVWAMVGSNKKFCKITNHPQEDTVLGITKHIFA